MRIALIVERFEPGVGGVETAAWSIAHEVQRQGDDMTVVCRIADPSAKVRIARATVSDAWQPARVWRFSKSAARLAPRNAYDVVYSLSRTRHQDVFRAGGGSHLGYMERRYGGPGRLLRRASPRHATLLALERAVFGDASQRIQCNSEMVRAELARHHAVSAERTRVIRNGVDLERFGRDDLVGHRARLREELGADGGPVWLFAGSGFARKGLDTAVRALAASARADSQLWVAGSDAAEPWQRLTSALGVSDRVRFLGFRDDLPELLASSDALLLPTRYDASANVCLEAAAARVPVVTSGANGAAEIFSSRDLLVEDPEDVAGFATALDRLDDAGTRERLGTAARNDVASLDWPSQVAMLRGWFAEIAT